MQVSPSAVPGAGPEPAPREVLSRVEVSDAESGAYVPGADVSVVFPGGKASKRTDTGGNAAFFRDDFAGVPPEVLGAARYRVEKPGYAPQERPFMAGEIASFSLVRAAGAAPAPAEFPTTAVVVGGLAAAALVAVLALR